MTNIVIATRSSYPNGPTPLRMDLFRYVTVPSLKAQTDPRFVWLIAASDKDHAEWIKEETQGLTVLVRLSSDFTFALSNHDLRQARLDGDDAVASDFVERLRAAGPHSPGTWYSFPNGYRVHEGQCEPYHNPTNQFIALDLPDNSSRHVYEIKHTKLNEQRDVVEVDVKPAWLFVRHNESKSLGGRQPTRQSLDRLHSFKINHQFLAGVR